MSRGTWSADDVRARARERLAAEAARRRRGEPARKASPTALLCHDLAQHVVACLLVLGAAQETAGLPAAAAGHLAALAEELDAIALIITGETGAGRHRAAAVDLGALVAACALTAERAHSVSVRLHIHAAPRVIGVENRLRRAVDNVLDNACKASPTGNVAVALSAREGRAVLEITDDGPGFGKIPRGTGLGLEQVLDTVESHGGDLEVERSRAGTTTVRISLPVARTLAR